MGHTVSVHNRTDKKLIVISFNNSDILYWHYKEMRLISVNGIVDLDGLAGGEAVKIGVVYDVQNENLVYDLFRVADKATLIVEEADEYGVKWVSDDSVKLLKRGKIIPESADQDAAINFGLSLTGVILNAAGRSTDIARSAYEIRSKKSESDKEGTILSGLSLASDAIGAAGKSIGEGRSVFEARSKH